MKFIINVFCILFIGWFLGFVAAAALLTNPKYKTNTIEYEPVIGNIIRKQVICEDHPECLKLAEAIYFEARSESRRGQVAVGYVIINRVFSPNFPNTIRDVVNDRCQFEYRCDGSVNRGVQEPSAWETAVDIANSIVLGHEEDPTGGSTHYVNKNKLKRIPNWVLVYEETTRIGSHTFYKENV